MVPAHVSRIASLNVRDQAVHIGTAAVRQSVVITALGADVDACRDENLGIRIWRNDGADVAAVKDRASGAGSEVALPLDQRLTDALVDRHAGGEGSDGFAPQSRISEDAVVERASRQRISFMIRVTACF